MTLMRLFRAMTVIAFTGISFVTHAQSTNEASELFESAKLIYEGASGKPYDARAPEYAAIRTILDAIVELYPESELAVSILLDDTIEGLDLAKLNRVLAQELSDEPLSEHGHLMDGSDAEPKLDKSGPPLTSQDKHAARISVGQCWVVDSAARKAGVIVTVEFSLNREGQVEGDVRQVSVSGGDAATQRAAFDVARRAILRCGARGFPLPPEKYDHWREIEMTFNPQGIQFR